MAPRVQKLSRVQIGRFHMESVKTGRFDMESTGLQLVQIIFAGFPVQAPNQIGWACEPVGFIGSGLIPITLVHTCLHSPQPMVLSFHIDPMEPYIDIPIFLSSFGDGISHCMLCDALHSLEVLHNQS